jgi:hypothetical protein
MNEDKVMMKDGKMMVERNGELMLLEEEIVMKDGTRIMVNGQLLMADGTARMLREGESMYLDDEMTDREYEEEMEDMESRDDM